MGKDPFQFVRGEDPPDPLRHGNRGVLGVSSRGEGVGGFRGDHIDLRHRNRRRRREPVDHGVQFRRFRLGNLLRAVHPEHDLVGEPVGPGVHEHGEAERHDHAALAADVVADRDEQDGEKGQQKPGFQ